MTPVRITSDALGDPNFKVSEEPGFTMPLPISPSGIEKEVASGMWVKMSAAVWSRRDLIAIDAAVNHIKRFEGVISLGVRPAFSGADLALWHPRLVRTPQFESPATAITESASCDDIRMFFHTPAWTFLRNGSVLLDRLGPMSENELRTMMSRVFSIDV